MTAQDPQAHQDRRRGGRLWRWGAWLHVYVGVSAIYIHLAAVWRPADLFGQALLVVGGVIGGANCVVIGLTCLRHARTCPEFTPPPSDAQPHQLERGGGGWHG